MAITPRFRGITLDELESIQQTPAKMLRYIQRRLFQES